MSESPQSVYSQIRQGNKKQLQQSVDKHSKSKEEIEEIMQRYRKFLFTDTIFGGAKSKQFFESALKQVHPNIKYNKQSKQILRIILKVFLQQLAQESFQIRQRAQKNTIDIECVNQAYRKITKPFEAKSVTGNFFK